MFRRLPHSLPADPTAPTSLNALGCFINDMDQIRLINDPESKYKYNISKSDRVNDVHLAALNDCVRDMVKQRLSDAELEGLRLPLGSQKTDPHTNIYASKDIKEKKRVLIVFGQRHVDAGIFSFGGISTEGINVGSAVAMVQAIRNTPDPTHTPGVILTNPSQLTWYRGGGCAIGDSQWLNLSRASAVHQPFRVDPVKNRIPGNATYRDHVKYIFEHVLTSQIHPDAKLDIIGMEYTGMEVMHYLAEHWTEWAHRINGICLGNPQHTVQDLQATSVENPSFMDFVRRRCRAYLVSDMPVDNHMAGIKRVGCNCYASGEEFYEDGILIKGWRSMLDWFNMVSTADDYEEPSFTTIDVPANGDTE